MVRPIGLGAMPMSIEGRPDEATSIEVICAAIDAGHELIDTADAYCLDEHDVGHNERLVAKALAASSRGRQVLVATKGGVRRPGGAWVHDGRPAHIRSACEASLRALGVEAITLYQLHAPDREVPFEDTVGALADLKAEGKVEHVGLSNVDVGLIERARQVVPIVSVQNQASPYHPQGLSDGVLSYCESEGIAFIAYSPLGGWRAGRIAHEPVLQRLSLQLGATPYQVVLAWLLKASPALIAIPGASKVESALGSAGALDLSLSLTDLDEMNATFAAKISPRSPTAE